MPSDPNTYSPPLNRANLTSAVPNCTCRHYAMQLFAKDLMKKTAVSKGIDWDGHVARMEAIGEVSEAISHAPARVDI